MNKPTLKTFYEEVSEQALSVLDGGEDAYIKPELLNTESRMRRACSIIRGLGYKPRSRKQLSGGWCMWVSSK